MTNYKLLALAFTTVNTCMINSANWERMGGEIGGMGGNGWGLVCSRAEFG